MMQPPILPEQVQTSRVLFTTTFVFPWKVAPLSLNQRLHHMAKAKITAELRSLMHAEARRIPELDRCEVRLVWVVNSRRRRDEENIVATLKPLCDGLVDAEVVPDDTPQFMHKLMPEIRYEKGATPHFEFTITEVTA
jgi:hypothetical protein